MQSPNLQMQKYSDYELSELYSIAVSLLWLFWLFLLMEWNWLEVFAWAFSQLIELVDLQVDVLDVTRRLALVREEKEAMAKVLERLQFSAGNSTSDREDWRIRDVVRTLEEQLVKERAKSQRSATKRCQEQRLLIEQVRFFIGWYWCFSIFTWLFLTAFFHFGLVGGAEGIRVSASCSGKEPHKWTGITTKRVRQSNGVLHLPTMGVEAFHVRCSSVSAAERLQRQLASAHELTGKSIARSPVRGGRDMGHAGLAQDPESG